MVKFFNAYVSNKTLIDESKVKSNHPDVDIFLMYLWRKIYQSKQKLISLFAIVNATSKFA